MGLMWPYITLEVKLNIMKKCVYIMFSFIKKHLLRLDFEQTNKYIQEKFDFNHKYYLFDLQWPLRSWVILWKMANFYFGNDLYMGSSWLLGILHLRSIFLYYPISLSLTHTGSFSLPISLSLSHTLSLLLSLSFTPSLSLSLYLSLSLSLFLSIFFSL